MTVCPLSNCNDLNLLLIMEPKTIYSRFKHICDIYPDKPAIIEDDRTFSFSQLREMTEAIRTKFPSSPIHSVGIVMAHGAEQIAAMLAVLGSGAAYVPAEPSLPAGRIEFMMHNADVDFIINDKFCHNLDVAERNLPDLSSPDSLAYILYTSGTSGKPKGVAVENHSVVNYADAFEKEFSVGPGDRMLQYSVCSFDIFVEEIFASLLNGAAVCIPSQAIRNDSIKALMQFVERHKITIIDGFPYLLAEINKLSEIPSSVKLIISGGDVIRMRYITNLRNKGIKIYNTYGPSETTVCSNYFRIDNAEPLSDGTFPIGKAVSGVEVRIIDDHLQEVAEGTTGEICILGEGVARGYLGDVPEQKNFVTLPSGERMFRSGDLGYRLPDGNIAFLRRRDDQIMILGKRVEPEEVENVLNTVEGIETGIVRAFTDEDNLHYLVAYFVAQKPVKASEIRKALAEELTDFMIPEFFIKMNSIPITRRGKVDMSELPVPLKSTSDLKAD